MATIAATAPRTRQAVSPGIWLPAYSLWQREIVRFYRQKARVAGVIASPLIFWVVLGAGFAQPKVGRGAAFGDFDNDGDLDVLITTNNGPAYLYRNDRIAGNHSIRFRLIGTQSNRDGIGAMVRIYFGGRTSSRMVRSGSSYLSQSELPVTFGLGKRESIDRAVIRWPNGRVEEFKNLKAGRYDCVEAKGMGKPA